MKILYCHAHPEQDIMCECLKYHEKSVLENIVKEIKGKIENSNANFEWINGMWDTINIINKRIRELDEGRFGYDIESSVKQEDVCDIMNLINDALENTDYEAVAYDNTGIWLSVLIDKK